MRPPAAGTAWQAMAMQLRDDPSTVELVAFDATEWIASPQPAVTRKLLEQNFTDQVRKMVNQYRTAVPGMDIAKVLGIG